MREGKFLQMPTGEESNLYFDKSKYADKGRFIADIEMIEDMIDKKDGGLFDILKEHSIEISPEREKVLEVVIENVNKVIEKYGLHNDRVSVESIYILATDLIKRLPSHEELDVDNLGGSCFPLWQTVILSDENNSTRMQLAANAFHEFMHMNSFNRLRLMDSDTLKEKGNVFPDRFGLGIANLSDPAHFKFNKFNEAVTQKLTLNFLKDIRDNDLFDEEFELMDGKYGVRCDDHVLRKTNPDENGKVHYYLGAAYKNEVWKLERLMSQIHEENAQMFSSVDEVFDVFVKAYFSGNILELANLIEKTKGKGSFRQLAESF